MKTKTVAAKTVAVKTVKTTTLMSEGASSAQAAAIVVSELIRLGVRDFVVCPGSRSQALALAAYEAERRGLARLHVRIDERSAAFFALGIGLESNVPAAVIVTSGTAVGNLLPATMEAYAARVPLILLTADRPKSMRGIRANQTVHSAESLKLHTRFYADIAAQDFGALEFAEKTLVETYRAAVGSAPGPAQLNISFVEPLSDANINLTPVGQLAAQTSEPLNENESVALPSQSAAAFDSHSKPSSVYVHASDSEFARAIIIAGDKAGPEAEAFAHKANLPLLAEPSSGARFGREAIQHWETLLQLEELQNEVQRIIIFGHPTLTRVVNQLVKTIDTVVIDTASGNDRDVSDQSGDETSVDKVSGDEAPADVADRFDPHRNVKVFAQKAEVAKNYDRQALKSWLGKWVVTDRSLREQLTTVHQPDLVAAKETGYKERSAYARSEVARMRRPVTREHLTETLWLATWPHDRLVVASSRLIRVLNKMATPRNIKVFANRGLAGIDGTIATALGVAVSSQTVDDPRLAAGTTRLLIGDLAFFHDVASLNLQKFEYTPRLQIIVANDGGGSIFDTLEVAETADPEAYERVMRTPQQIDIEALARAYRWEYRAISTEGELENLMTEQVQGPQIVEVRL